MQRTKLFCVTALAVAVFLINLSVYASPDTRYQPTSNPLFGAHWAFTPSTQQHDVGADSTIALLQTGWDRYGIGAMTDHHSYGWRSIVFWTIGTSVENQVFDALMPQSIRWSYDPFQHNWFRAEAWRRDPAIRYYLMPNTARDPVRGQPQRSTRRID